jgi:hypothetical protein
MPFGARIQAQDASSRPAENVPDILVRNIEEIVAERIKMIARERQWTINEVILHLLHEGLGFAAGDETFRREMHDIAVLAGTWDQRETAAFRSAVEAFEKVEGQPLFSDSEGSPESPAESPPKNASDQLPK